MLHVGSDTTAHLHTRGKSMTTLSDTKVPAATPTPPNPTVAAEIARLKKQLHRALDRAEASEREAAKPKGIELLFPILRR